VASRLRRCASSLAGRGLSAIRRAPDCTAFYAGSILGLLSLGEYILFRPDLARLGRAAAELIGLRPLLLVPLAITSTRLAAPAGQTGGPYIAWSTGDT
jgi:hypothetical protein